MITFKPAASIPPGAMERLEPAIAGMTSFGRACFGEVALPGEEATAPGLVVECTGFGYRDDAQTIAVVMEPYFRDRQVFNVIPVPPGPWWNQLTHIGRSIR